MHCFGRWFLGLSLCALIAGSASWAAAEPFADAKSNGRLTIGFANEKPFAYEQDGELTGEAPAVIRAIAARYGIEKVEGVLTEFSALIPGLKARRFDIIGAGMYIRPARCAEVAFTNPDIALGEALIVKKGNPLAIGSYADIAKNSAIRMGVGRGGVESELAPINGVLESQITVFADLTTLMSGLTAGRVDVIGVPQLSAGELIANAGSDDVEIANMTEQPKDKNGKLAISYGATAFPKEHQEDVAAYNAALADLKKSGELLKIISRFGFTAQNIPDDAVTAETLCAE